MSFHDDKRREFREQFFCRYCLTTHLQSETCRDMQIDAKAMRKIALSAVRELAKKPRPRKRGGFKAAVREIEKAED